MSVFLPLKSCYLWFAASMINISTHQCRIYEIHILERQSEKIIHFVTARVVHSSLRWSDHFCISTCRGIDKEILSRWAICLDVPFLFSFIFSLFVFFCFLFFFLNNLSNWDPVFFQLLKISRTTKPFLKVLHLNIDCNLYSQIRKVLYS